MWLIGNFNVMPCQMAVKVSLGLSVFVSVVLSVASVMLAAHVWFLRYAVAEVE